MGCPSRVTYIRGPKSGTCRTASVRFTRESRTIDGPDHVRHGTNNDAGLLGPRVETVVCSCTPAPADYSITSSARASSEGDMVRPRVLAVFKFMTSSYLLGACTGRSAGFSPRKIRSTYAAARRY